MKHLKIIRKIRFFKRCRRFNCPICCTAFYILDAHPPASKGKQFFSSSDSEDDEDSRKKFKIRIKPLVADSAKCVPPSMDELKASVGGLALSPSLVRTADQYSCSAAQHWRAHTLSLHVCLISCLYICLFLSPICRHLVEEKSGKLVRHFHIRGLRGMN